MLPGNRPEDVEWDELHDQIDKDCGTFSINPSDASTAWSIGLAALPYIRKCMDLAYEEGQRSVEPPTPPIAGRGSEG